MSHVTKSKDWIDLFDVVVCSARKPFFYNDVNRYLKSLKQFYLFIQERGSAPIIRLTCSFIFFIFNLLYFIFHRPFRLLNRESLSPSWERVTSLEPGSVYNQGNIKEFVKLTGWKGAHVLYIGDHVYTDLSVSRIERSLVPCKDESIMILLKPQDVFVFAMIN